MYTNTSEIPTKKITTKVDAVRDKILPVKAKKQPKVLKPQDKLVKTPAKPKILSKTTMTASMSDPEGMGKAHPAGMGKKHTEGVGKPSKEGQNKRYKTKTTPEEIIARHKEEQELDKTKYKAEMQTYLKERLKQGKNKIKLDHSIKQLEAKIKAA
jgi:hypothetical protein